MGIFYYTLLAVVIAALGLASGFALEAHNKLKAAAGEAEMLRQRITLLDGQMERLGAIYAALEENAEKEIGRLSEENEGLRATLEKRGGLARQ